MFSCRAFVLELEGRAGRGGVEGRGPMSASLSVGTARERPDQAEELTDGEGERMLLMIPPPRLATHTVH